MKVNYIKASEEHAEQIFSIENELFSANKFSLNQILTELNSDDRYYIVAVVNKQVVGFAGVSISFDFAEIMKIAVAKKHQNLGVATTMLNKLIKFCKQIGMIKIMLEVSEKNLTAINFYKNFGFNKIHKRKNYYSDSSDALIFELII